MHFGATSHDKTQKRLVQRKKENKDVTDAHSIKTVSPRCASLMIRFRVVTAQDNQIALLQSYLRPPLCFEEVQK